MTTTHPDRLKRLRYLSGYRGCKETDLILGRFAEAYLDTLNETELDEYEVLLDENDADIYRWYTGQYEIPERLQNNTVLKRILAFTLHNA